MVKGISKQVILLRGPETELFEQAIFILKDNAGGITEDVLLKEAKKLINSPKKKKHLSGPVWAFGGAVLTGMIWLFSILL